MSDSKPENVAVAVATKTTSKPPPLPTGMPPWHSVAFLVTALSIAIPYLPSLEDLDEHSDASVWTSRKFPDLLSLRTMAIVRLVVAGIALGLTAWLALIEPGWDVDPVYKARSRCHRGTIRLQGLGSLCPFTSWSWLVLGLGFLTRGLVALAAAIVAEKGPSGSSPAWTSAVLSSPAFLRLTLVLWELTGPTALLVSCAVKYAIWPQVLKGGKPHKLASFRNQLQHNSNAFVALLEIALMGGIPVRLTHLSMAMLYDATYMVFTWFMAVYYFGSDETGPQYLYWFLDTTLEEVTTYAMVALCFAHCLFFVIFSGIGTVLGSAAVGGEEENDVSPPNLPLNVAFLAIGTRFACKFGPSWVPPPPSSTS